MSGELIRGAVVEIIDVGLGTDRGPLMPTRVRINGTDVGYIAKGSLVIEPGNRSNGDPTSVTLTLFPSQLVVRGTEKPQ